MDTRSVRGRDAATYGMAMLVAKGGRELSQRWLQEWQNNDSHLKAGALREQMMLHALTGALATGDQLALVDNLDTPTAARWLVSAASRRPEEAEVFVRVIEDRGLVKVLSSDDRVRLAAVYGNLAWLKERGGDSLEEVMPLVGKALALDPQNETGMIYRAVALYRQGQHQAALELLTLAVDLHPRSGDVWEALAGLELKESNLQAAESASRMAISLPPSGGTHYRQYLLATALLKQGRCAEALPHAQLAFSMLPDQYEHIYLLLGDVYWCLGDKKQASIIYQRLEAIAPGYRPYVRERINATE